MTTFEIGGCSYVAREDTRALGTSARVTRVRGTDGDAWLVALTHPDAALLDRERALRDAPHVRAAEQIAWTDATESATYRTMARREDALAWALFPCVRAVSLAPVLARARAGAPMPIEPLFTLAVHVARGLVDTAALGALVPSAITIDETGCARVRGPLLDVLVRSEPVRWMHYFAPEQIRAGAARPGSARAFALGVMLYELAAGRPLFPTGAVATSELARWEITLAHTTLLGERCPEALRAVIWSLLQRDPHRRGDARWALEQLAPLAPAPDALRAIAGSEPSDAALFAT